MKFSRIKLFGVFCAISLLAVSSVVPPAQAVTLDVSFASASASCETGFYSVHADAPIRVAYNPLNLFRTGSAAAARDLALKVVVTDSANDNILGESTFSTHWETGDVSGSIPFSSAPTGDEVTFTLYWADLPSTNTVPGGLLGPSRAMAGSLSALLDVVTVDYMPCTPRPGCDLLDLTGAVMGTLVTDTPLYYAPDANAQVYPVTLMEQGKTVWVFGQDETHEYYQIQMGCGYLWLPAASLTPDGEDLWNNAPLPGEVVGEH